MKDIAVALIGMLGGVLTAILTASWFTPDLLRFDAFLPTKETQVLDDFVYVHFEGYRERGAGQPIEVFQNPYTLTEEKVFDKATYVEHVGLRNTKGSYTIRLTTSGAAPEIRSISPSLKERHYEQTASGDRIMTADLALDQSQEFKLSGKTPSPKMVYVFRNGYQERRSSGGKNVGYDSDRLTFVYDFSALPTWQKLFQVTPKACLKKLQEDYSRPLELKWENGVAIVEAISLKRGGQGSRFLDVESLSTRHPSLSASLLRRRSQLTTNRLRVFETTASSL